VYEFKTSLSGFFFDASGNVDDSTSATSQAGVGLKLSGTTDVIVQVAVISTRISAIGGGYTLNIDGHGNGEAYLANTASGTAPPMTLGTSGTAAAGAIALSTH
jgi:hypothetical protein